METKIYSSSGFSHHCSTEELFVLTRHWLSDIAFFEQEIQFLQMLVTDYHEFTNSNPEREQIEALNRKFIDLQARKTQLKDNIVTHQNELSAILDKNLKEEQPDLNTLQLVVEGEFFDFIKTFRKVKQDLFALNNQLRKAALMQKA